MPCTTRLFWGGGGLHGGDVPRLVPHVIRADDQVLGFFGIPPLPR